MKNIGTICGHFFPASCVSASIVTTFEETIERQLSCSCEDINSWPVSSLPPSDACVFRTKIITSKKGSPSHVDFRPVLARITKAVLQFSCYRLRVVVSTASNGKIVCLWKQQVSLMHNNGTMSCPVFESTLASWVLNDSYQHVFVIPLYIPQFDGVLTLFRNRKMLKFIKRFRENNCFWVTFPAKVWNAPVSATTPENYAKNVPLKMANAKDAAKTRQKTTHEIYFSHSVFQMTLFSGTFGECWKIRQVKTWFRHALLLRRLPNFKQSNVLCSRCQKFTAFCAAAEICDFTR
jgi:hypothetical protein